MSETYQAIVLGLGAVGSATTYQLAKQGARVLGIDQFSPPHTLGSFHGDSRITREAIGEGGKSLAPLAIRSNEIWRDLGNETHRPVYTRTGGLTISSEGDTSHNHVDNFFEQSVAAAKKFSIEHELLSSSDIRKRFPQFNVADDEFGFFETNAGILNADEGVRTNLEFAQANEAELHTNEKLLGYEQHGDLVQVTTDQSTYQCEHLIVCAGPWISEMMGSKYAELFSVSRQVLCWFDVEEHYQEYIAGVFPVFIWELRNSDRPIYGFPAINGATSGVKVSAERFDFTTTPDEINRTVTPEEINDTYEKYFEPFFNGMNATCINTVTCMYTTTPDAQFIVDTHPDFSGVTIVSPCSGHGFKHSAALGEAIAQKILTGTSTIDLSEFALSRFDKSQ